MISNLLQIPLPQSSGGKKTKKSKGSLPQDHLKTKLKKKVTTPNHFAQILLDSTHLQKPQKFAPLIDRDSLLQISKPAKDLHKNISNHKRSIKQLLTQNRLKIQNQPDENKLEQKLGDGLKEALSLGKSKKRSPKTLKEIHKIAQDHQLNLTRLEISSNESKKPKLSKQTRTPVQVSTLKTKHPKITIPNENKTQMTAQITMQAQPTPLSLQPEIKPTLVKESLLAEMLSSKLQAIDTNDQEMQNETKNEKPQETFIQHLKKETQFKIAQNRETMMHFSQRLKEEIANYKPPLTKLSMELNPQELGKLEVTITKKGKDLQININANNPNALQVFMQNQNDFRNTLSSAGFNHIELGFFQGDSQKQRKQDQDDGRQNQKRNRNSLENIQDNIPLISSMEIKMVQYA